MIIVNPQYDTPVTIEVTMPDTRPPSTWGLTVPKPEPFEHVLVYGARLGEYLTTALASSNAQREIAFEIGAGLALVIYDGESIREIRHNGSTVR